MLYRARETALLLSVCELILFYYREPLTRDMTRLLVQLVLSCRKWYWAIVFKIDVIEAL